MFSESFLKLALLQFESFWTKCNEAGVPDFAKEDMLKTWLGEFCKEITNDIIPQ